MILKFILTLENEFRKKENRKKKMEIKSFQL